MVMLRDTASSGIATTSSPCLNPKAMMIVVRLIHALWSLIVIRMGYLIALRLSDREIGWFNALDERGLISTPLNWGLLFNADSRFPELAGPEMYQLRQTATIALLVMLAFQLVFSPPIVPPDIHQ